MAKVELNSSGVATIANNAVTTAKIANENVTLAKLQKGSAGQLLLMNPTPDSAWTTMSGDVAINSSGVTTISNDAVTAAKFAQGTAGQVLMSNATPDTAWITVSGDLTAAGSGAFTIGNDAVTAAKVAQGTAGQVLMSNATPDTAWTTMSGDVTISSSGVTTIGSNAITGSELASGSVSTSKIAAGQAGKILMTYDFAATQWTALSGDVTANGSGVVTIGSGAITGAEIANDAVTAARISQGTASQILMSNATPDTAWTTMSGDVTINSSGVTTIGSNAITGSELSSASVAAAKLADAVADEVLTASLSIGEELVDTVICTYQVKDVQGNNLSAFFLVHWAITDSTTDPTTVTVNGVTTVHNTGSSWQSVTADKKGISVTNSSGVLTLNVTYSLAATMHLHVFVGGKRATGALTFAL